MNKHLYQQILYRVFLSSPLISALVIAPIYLVFDSHVQTFFELWFKAFIGTLIGWGVQIFLFSYFQKRGYPKWILVIVMALLILFIIQITKEVIFKVAPSFQSFTGEQTFMIRFLIMASINFIIYLILDLIYSREYSIRLSEKNAKLQFINLENEYQLLKSQINPHFLFNALNISKSLIKTQPKNAEKYIVQLSEFLRKSLNNQQKSISLKMELEHCNQYVDLQKVRFENAFEYLVDIDKEHYNKHLPFFALITLVENAVKHNSFSEEEPLKISITIKDDSLWVKNNIKQKNGVISTHTGLSSLNQRSKMISGDEIEIVNDGKHFLVKVKLIKL